MKKAFSAIVSLFMVLSLAACGNGQPAQSTAQADNASSSLEISASSAQEAPSSSSVVHPDAAESSSPETEASTSQEGASSAKPQASSNDNGKTLIAYFSLGRNAAYPDHVDAIASASLVVDGGGRYGTTEYVARMIQEQAGGDLHSIQTREPYLTDFDAVVDRNHAEMDAGTLPALTRENLDISQYDTVFLGYPVWATTAPQAILSFLSQHDLSGKTIVPFCTHNGYGAGSSYRDIAAAEPEATTLDGIAIEAPDVPDATNTVAGWLRELGLDGTASNATQSAETPITITIGNTVLNGVLYDTALADEIREQFPLTVSMGGFGGREYYGGIDFTPVNVGVGQLSFENGDITYCGRNNSIAIFYAQTDNPNLTMEIIPIGRVTSDLAAFDELPGSVDITFALEKAGFN